MQPSLKEIETIARQAGQILRDGCGQVHNVEMIGWTDPVIQTDYLPEARH